MTTAARSVEPVSIQVEFEDNRLLPAVFGEHGRNLARIEQRLGVSLNNRGNLVTISGPMDAVEVARDALDRLYRSAGRGHNVDQAEVDAAVRMAEGADSDVEAGAEPFIQTRRKRIVARSPNQAHYMRTISDHEMVFATGPAGTGKTYLAVCAAVAMLTAGRVDRIVLSRPAVEAGERLGFLPGDMRDKVDPYMQPLYDALYDALPAEQVVKRLETGEIEIAPLAFMRGRTLSNAYVILDEAQNTTPVQMKMALTRIGENSRMVITGDVTQIDLPGGQRSGLADALETLDGVKGIEFVHFTQADVVRHELVTRIIQAYDQRDGKQGDAK
ncbi:MAG: PhoH family protein [Pseudomonadota bacterium]